MARMNLAPDERVVHELRTHPKALFGHALIVVLVVVIAVAVGLLLPPEAGGMGWIVVAAVCVLAVLAFLAGPFLAWRSRTYTITDRRIITRRGVLTRTGHDIQLRKVSSVSYDRDLVDRLFGCGTLKLDTASEAGVVVLPDVPDVERVHLDLNELLFTADDDARDRARKEHE